MKAIRSRGQLDEAIDELLAFHSELIHERQARILNFSNERSRAEYDRSILEAEVSLRTLRDSILGILEA